MPADANEPLLSVRDLAVHFSIGGGLFKPAQPLKAVDGVSFDLKPGECLGLVGESGCGKSTLGMALLGLIAPTAGTISIAGLHRQAGDAGERMAMARTIQMVFQDPYASLNPRQTVRRTLEDPLRLHGIASGSELKDRTAKALADVGLRPEHADRYPHEFSGGQRQRIGIARALILEPRLIICDEPVSALDVSIRAQIINLLLELRDRLGLSYIMISHDLGVVEHMSDRVMVMYLGKLVETGGWRDIFERPRHPYTKALIAAIPDPFAAPSERLAIAKGEIPSALKPPSGCHFHPRCPVREPRCSQQRPLLGEVAPGHSAACLLETP